MSLARGVRQIIQALVAAVGRLDKSTNPRDTIARIRKHKLVFSDSIWLFHFALASFWLYFMTKPPFPYKLLIPILYGIGIMIPLTSQFLVPATPVLDWVITWYSVPFLPPSWRPTVSVYFLPTLESVLYGANISDILTRFTHPLLDVAAWLPYGVLHFVLPFVIAIFIWLFRPKQVLHLWARAFGYMNLAGVIIQILFPCAPPWYELIYGLTPASYDTPGSAAGLARIDKLFHGDGYAVTFSKSPVVFGAFPSLHAGCATMEALFVSHFFPHMTVYVWSYTAVLYWATMYLTHHYLIDVVAGACLAIAFFYLYLPDEMRAPGTGSGAAMSKYEIYDLETPRRGDSAVGDVSGDLESDDEGSDMDITAFRSPAATPTTGTPFVQQQQQQSKASSSSSGKPGGHRHTASIASLIRADERAEDGWSPVKTGGFTFPPPKSNRDGESSRK
jgi:inositol phosphorylceramide synthase catalytic subunit